MQANSKNVTYRLASRKLLTSLIVAGALLGSTNSYACRGHHHKAAKMLQDIPTTSHQLQP